MTSSNSTACYGLHAVQALLLANPSVVTQLYIQSNKLDQSASRVLEVLDLASQHHIPYELVDEKRLDHLAEGHLHQGVYASYVPPTHSLGDLLENISPTTSLLLLDGVQDPHNLGACLRTAWAAGVQGVVVPKDRSAGLTPTVHKVASGAAACVPLVSVTNLSHAMNDIKKAGVWCYGADEGGQTSLYDLDLKGPTAMVLGAEGKGLRALTQKQCDGLFHIPTQADFTTLNVSVATGVCLFEVMRQSRS